MHICHELRGVCVYLYIIMLMSFTPRTKQCDYNIYFPMRICFNKVPIDSWLCLNVYGPLVDKATAPVWLVGLSLSFWAQTATVLFRIISSSGYMHNSLSRWVSWVLSADRPKSYFKAVMLQLHHQNICKRSWVTYHHVETVFLQHLLLLLCLK